MDLQDGVNPLRKLGNFLAALYPALGRAWDALAARLARLGERPAVARALGWLAESRVGRVASALARRFAWRDYAKDRLDWQQVPADGAAILRPVFALTTALVLLLPVAAATAWPALAEGSLPGATRAVPAWSAALWLLAWPVAAGTLLAGAALANAWALAGVAVVVAFLAPQAGAAPTRAVWGAGPGLAFALALALAGTRRPATRAWSTAADLAAAGLTGAAATLLLVALSPLGPLKTSSPLAMCAALGAPAGVALHIAAGRWPRLARALTPPRVALGAALLLAADRASQVAAHGLGAVAGPALEALDLVNAWLWPLWAFVGVGIVHKLHGNARVVAGAIGDALPGRLLPACVLAGLALGAAVSWAPTLLTDTAWPWPDAVRTAATYVYSLTPQGLRTGVLSASWLAWMRWVLLFAALAGAWAAARRRLDTALAARLLFLVVMTGFLAYELLFETLAFARSPAHGALVLFLFAAWLVWLVYSVGLRLSLASSPRWPATSRLALFAGVLLVVVATLHARAATGDEGVRDEIFLFLFRGVVDVGLPYTLYVLLQRRLGSLPVAPARLLGAFVLGAALTVPLALADKLAAGGWTAAGLAAVVDARVAAMETGVAPAEGALPVAWQAARTALVLGALLAWAAWLRRRATTASERAVALPFLLTAAALGYASLVKTRVLWPLLGLREQVALDPWELRLLPDTAFVAHYAAWLLPALALSAWLGREGGPRRADWPVAAALAVGAHAAVRAVYPGQEALLEATGVLSLAALGGLGIVLLLLDLLVRRGEAALRDGAVAPGVARPVALAVALALLLVPAGWQLHRHRLTEREVPPVGGPVWLPAPWEALELAPPAVGFRFPSPMAPVPLLTLERRPLPAGDGAALLDGLVAEAQAQVPSYTPGALQRWDRFYPDALALDGTFEMPGPDGSPMYLAATTVVLPAAGGTALVASVMADFTSWEVRRWDLARMAQRVTPGP